MFPKRMCAMELRCAVQQYAWGKHGLSSKVAQIAKNNDPDFVANELSPYAELWMGTHPNGPSVIKVSGQELGDWVLENTDTLGVKVMAKFGPQLPFLFKVLSVREALSIQAHPSKNHAEELHRLRPDIYKDPNHKPELAIAITPFEALCGFRLAREIAEFLKNIPELRVMVGEEIASKFVSSDEANQQSALKECFQALMTASKPVIESNLIALVTRIASLGLICLRANRPVSRLTLSFHIVSNTDAKPEVLIGQESAPKPPTSLKDHKCKPQVHLPAAGAEVLAPLLCRLHSQFPGDVGCFAIYFLNFLALKPGEALYLGPNEPHAYLAGDCVECMACSDNVVRAGLTPKYKDVDTLCNMLNYTFESANSKLFAPTRDNQFTVVFRPPVPDFAVADINIPPSSPQFLLQPRDTASILLVLDGEGSTDSLGIYLNHGTVLFLPAGLQLNVTTSDHALHMFQAFANV
uniref:mannose-6-phosphate isomerase n=1 Tax=Timema monikensis TaxID=170555 RepID=A0A7R9E6X1_9NEOP|nr:unnamed protein product [Timema monikensis]